jgi:DNA-binding CsgD family transcriptional regulator
MDTFGRTLNIPFELFGTLMLFAMLWLLFYQLNYQDKAQESKTRRILLIIGMALYRPLLCIPLPGLLRILLPFAMIAVLAWLAGGKKRSVWIAAVYYCGITVSIDTIATAMVLGLTINPAFSGKELYFYGGISIYIVLFLAALIYYFVMRAVPRDAIDRIPLPVWLIPLLLQPAGTVALYAPMDSLLTQLEAGYNNFLFLGLFLIALTILNLVIFFLFVKLISGYSARLLAGEINKTPSLYSPQSGLSPEFIEKCALSNRETEVTEALLQGKSDKEIAVSLNIAVNTVRVHLKNIYRKTGTPGRYALMSLVGLGANNEDKQESSISNSARGADAHGTVYPESGLDRGRRFRLLNFLVILLCLSGAAFCINLFRLDLFGSFDNKNEEPVGTIIITNDTVRRRMANRVFWDRLTVDSHVYSGDQIRTADFSNVTLHIENNSIDLNEKTLIRIQRSSGDEDSIQIELAEGNLILTTVAGGGNLVLSIVGHQVEAAPGTILSASAGKDGAIMQVSEGTATLTGDGQRREIASGTMIALDTKGATIQEVPAYRPDAVPAGPQVPVEPVIELKELVPTEPQVPPQAPQPVLTLLAAPLNLQPPEGHRIGIEQLKESNSIVFAWSAVPGADAYIFTLYKIIDNERRQIIRGQPGNRRNWRLENLETLGDRTFIWQIEAVNISAGTIERRGRIAENSFVIDIPRSGMVEINEQ